MSEYLDLMAEIAALRTENAALRWRRMRALEGQVNDELIEKAHVAIVRLYYAEPLPSRQKIAEAVLCVAIEACAEIADAVEKNALNQIRLATADQDMEEWFRQQGRGLAATVIRQKIRALLTDAGATDAQPDAS